LVASSVLYAAGPNPAAESSRPQPTSQKPLDGPKPSETKSGSGGSEKDRAASAKPGSAFTAAVDSPHLGFTYYYRGPVNGSRFLAVHLLVTNSSTQPIVFKARDIILRADGTDYRLREILNGLQHQTLQAGGRTIELSRIKPLADLRVEAGATGTKWVVYTGIPAGASIPTMTLRVSHAGKTVEVNVNEVAGEMIGLKVERIGPRGSLALLTVSGELNTVNIGKLISVLETMTSQKVVRAVIRFLPTAPTLDGQVLTWLQQGAYFAGRGESNNPQLPAFPSALRELHLAAVPNRTANLDGSSGPQPRIHKTDAAAVRAALKSALEVLPHDELLAEIEKGDPLTRPAALAEGGGRLAAEDLPLVLHYADDKDPAMQLAALIALRHFGEPPAIEKLLSYARKNSEPTVSTAIESLTASRYAVAHQALLNILKNEHPASRRLIVRVLAKYPRPIWADTIYSFVHDPEPQVAVEALRALERTGHAALFDVLKDALDRGTGPVRSEAFQLLASRNDRQSEELALGYTLEAMKSGPPTPAMYQLLNRTKEPRAIPLLLAQLDRPSNSRSEIIGTLAQIGDQSVAEALASRYATFSDRDKTATLNALQLLKSPRFRKLAGDALSRGDTSLVNAAVNGLQSDGSPQAVQLLVEALESSTSPTVWPFITSALGNFGTAESKAALKKTARFSQNAQKRRLALEALRLLQQRSPGFGYCLQAIASARAERWDEAIARYGSAIELDPELPEAYSGRGHAFLNKKKIAEARKDFTKAIELDPLSSEAVTGLGICLVQEGQVEGGIKVIEDSRSHLKDEYLFTYNAACVYGRALERTLKLPKSAERDKKAETYRAKSIADLRRSVKLGFPDLDWMKKDPDLDTLHGTPEFKKISSPDENHSPDENSNEDNDGTGKTGAGKTAIGDGGGASRTDDAIKADLLFENARP